MQTIAPPARDEYAPFYAGYVARVPAGAVLQVLRDQPALLQRTFGELSEEQARYCFAPEAWSIKQVVGHLGDGERVFAYRAAAVARGEQAPLPSFDQDAYVAAAGYDDRPLGDLLAEFVALRQATLLTFQHISPAALDRRGTVAGGQMSVRALLYIIAGHVLDHLSSLQGDYFDALGLTVPAHEWTTPA